MEDDAAFDGRTTAGKIYKDKEVWVGTYLGGTIVAGYMIAENFKQFGEKDKARKTWWATIIATILLFLIAFYAPFIDRLPRFLFPLVYTGIAVVLMQMYQGEAIRNHLRASGKIQSWGKALGVTLIGLVATAVPFVGFGYLLDSVANANVATVEYGAMQNEISFDKTNITKSEIDALADGLTKTSFFDNRGKWSLYARKVESAYEISVGTTKEAVKSPENLAYFAQQRTALQALFPNNKIVFNLVVDDFADVVKRLE